MTKNRYEWKGPVWPYGGRDKPGNAFICQDNDNTPYNKTYVHKSMAECKIEPHRDGTCGIQISEHTQAKEGGRTNSRTLSFVVPADMWEKIKSHEWTQVEG